MIVEPSRRRWARCHIAKRERGGVNSTVLELDIADHAVVDSPTRLRSCQRRGGYPSPF